MFLKERWRTGSIARTWPGPDNHRMANFPVETSPRIKRLAKPFQEFAADAASGGIVLLICTAAALIWANSPWSASYHALWHTRVTVGFGDLSISESLSHWINDGLMAIFFFVVGLEIKRELLVGELASLRQAALSVAAALGGMIVPALIYFALNAGTPEVRGWAIPMATDIAFALGILALMGSRVPVALKVFLAAAAIADDLAAVLVIALFYTAKISVTALAAAGMLIAVLALANFLGIRRTSVYVFLGIALWVAVLESGIHATIAGVVLAMTIPATIRIRPETFLATVNVALDSFKLALGIEEKAGVSERQGAIHVIEEACHDVETPLMRLEHALTGWVAFVIMPVFALANAGLDLRSGFGAALTSSAGLGIVLGLILGKAIGITGMTWIVARMGIGELPRGVSWTHIIGVSFVAGVGFTMALFIAGLAFGDGSMLNVAKSGIMVGSLLAGLIGFFVLRSAKSPGTAA